MGSKMDINTGKKISNAGKRFALCLLAVLIVACIALIIISAIYINDGSLHLPKRGAASINVSTPKPTHESINVSTPKPTHDQNGYYNSPGISCGDDNPLPAIIEAVSPSVVGVVNYEQSTSTYRDELVAVGSGTGFIVSEEGYILTNEHVVSGADELRVSFENGDEVVAELIGSDVTTDVAVLKIQYDGLVPVTLGDSQSLRVGEFVLAIGNPLGGSELYGTVTLGIVSAAAREVNIDGFSNMYIQTDAAINFGNSGGPLINMRGEVIGMNTAKYVTAGYDDYGNSISAEGIGFALPINEVRVIMEQLIELGRIQRPGIGVTVYPINEVDAQEMELVAGIYVVTVTEGGAADKAGIKAGDVLVSADGAALVSNDDLKDAINQTGIGNSLIFGVYREGREFELTVTVGDMNEMS